MKDRNSWYKEAVLANPFKAGFWSDICILVATAFAPVAVALCVGVLVTPLYPMVPSNVVVWSLVIAVAIIMAMGGILKFSLREIARKAAQLRLAEQDTIINHYRVGSHLGAAVAGVTGIVVLGLLVWLLAGTG